MINESFDLSDDALEILRQRELVVFMDVIKDEEHKKPGSKIYLNNSDSNCAILYLPLFRNDLSCLREVQVSDVDSEFCHA